MGKGNISFSSLISAIYSLVNPQQCSDFCLRQIMVFTEVTQSWQVHINHLGRIIFYYQSIVLTLQSNDSKILT